MTDPGLSTRLRQHSRRAGLVVGVSMALTIAVCVGGFVAIYAGLVPYVSDFVPIAPPAATRPPSGAIAAAPEQTPAEAAAIVAEAAPAPTSAPPPTPAPETFQPTHQIGAGQSVNFRAGPSRNDPVIVALPPATELQFLDERQGTDNPNDQPGWMKFRTRDGQEGWIREIDTEPYQP